ncbi:MAG: hypothetical protein IKF18_03805, partial [Erysipelotrichaceae bacterium]|nr:hypothetical protein [Erysipelotrichaceae bacterium]
EITEPVVETVEEVTEPVVEAIEETVEEVVEPVVETAEEIQETVEEAPETVEETVEPVAETVEEPEPVVAAVEKTIAEITEPADDFLKETLNEVTEYNKSQGLVTADEVPNTILDEIRGIHREEPAVEVKSEPEPVVETVEEPEQVVVPEVTPEEAPAAKENEKEFNDTLTLQIHDIMAALEAQEAKEEVVEAPKEEVRNSNLSEIEKLIGISGTYSKTSLASEIERLMGDIQPEETAEEPEVSFEPEEATDSTKVFAPSEPVKEKQEETIEHPSLAVALEEPEEEVEETAEVAEPTNELLNETKPFIIEKTKTNAVIEDEDYDDDEEPAPSKLLNIILIVLTIALIAVLGVVIYGLLKTEGII